jgi:hypothetical protein
MPDKVRNLAWLRGLKLDGVPEFGPRLHELVSDMIANDRQLAQQTNSSLSGSPSAPPPLQGVTVTPSETGVHISVQHEGEYYRGVEYHGDYSDNAHFSNPFPFSMGPNREHDLPVGTQKLYYRVFAQYQTGTPGNPVYHGGATPAAVTGGTNVPRGTSQGAGTGRPGQGLQGYGSIPFKSVNGAPPVRST